MPKTILVMCYGNIYRSPFVSYYLQSLLSDELPFKVQSAGFHEKEGRLSEPEHVQYCKKWNIDLSTHRSRKVTEDLFDWADIIIIMDGHNYNMAKIMAPSISAKLIWLGGLSNRTPNEISDPYGLANKEQAIIVNQLADATLELSKTLITHS